MQELLHAFYTPFVNENYNDQNICTHPEIAKTILRDKNRGIEITLKNGNKYRITSKRIID